MERVRSIDAVQVVITGVVNTRRFERRDSELLVIDDLFDRTVQRVDQPGSAVIFDVAMRPSAAARVGAVRGGAAARAGRSRSGDAGHSTIVDWSEISILRVDDQTQGTDQLIAQMEDMKPADVARELHDLSPAPPAGVVAALDDQKLADALEELPEDEQVQLIQTLDPERAADVLEEMDPDDAADLIAELAPEIAERLLERMEPDEAKDLRRLLTYAEFTAGGMMTTEPVILPPDATVAEALAAIRESELTPALACMVYICRSPLETPTGRFLGAVHFQRLLREPPSTLVSALVDSDLEPLTDKAGLNDVSRYFATYNLVNAPVVDGEHRLIGRSRWTTCSTTSCPRTGEAPSWTRSVARGQSVAEWLGRDGSRAGPRPRAAQHPGRAPLDDAPDQAGTGTPSATSPRASPGSWARPGSSPT